jgi:hypothetical protein
MARDRKFCEIKNWRLAACGGGSRRELLQPKTQFAIFQENNMQHVFMTAC